ncbi:GNAT family N-acetyltransferase [Fulvivirga sp. M361]|uniref:GNAT family N-acetyltransferase n=1 Tax=Fulvivirga sp. M361 TaxID=2594266 RepID=UPI00117BB36D|nr:GNAT family N-acetyltransferase [Fulvivirga sp. M361]TRX59364.1 GNAT family N-acetyltransferase [Fulvivirga sp. M361]
MEEILSIPYHVENTTLNDLDFVCWLYDEAIKYQKKNNYFGWQEMDREYLQKEIERKLHYKIVQDGTVICAFGVVFSDPLIWREMDQGRSIYLHRIVVNPNFKGQKQFAKVLQWAINYSAANGLNSIRMDTWTANPSIIDFYKEYGFQFVEEFKTGNAEDLPVQHRNLDVTLLEYSIK